METAPFPYPGLGETPNRQWFAGASQSVFDALNPFLRLPGHPPWKNGDLTPESTVKTAKRQAPPRGIYLPHEDCAPPLLEMSTGQWRPVRITPKGY